MITTIVALAFFTQYFGQNKIQYENYRFKILSTEHFNIYFHEGGEGLAAFAEEVLEDGYDLLHEDLGIDIGFTVPVILYNSPNDFAQTNVTLDLIEESVGGFTELMKNRMVIPFTGDYEEFRHVLVHELAHVFQFAIFFPNRMEALFAGDIFYSIPLWAMEGHAEFTSLEWDIGTDVFMRDLVMHNNVIPLHVLGSYGGYLVYKQGQAFYKYVAEVYGRQKVGEFLHLLKTKKNLENTFIALFGVPIEEFNDKFLRYYQLKYWPKITLQDNFDNFARVVYDHRKTRSIYNTSTAISSSGDKVAFISDNAGVAELYIISSIDGQVLKKLVKASYSPGYEGLHLYQGGVSWSPDDSYITFAARAHGEDVLYVIDAQSGRMHKKFTPHLDGIYSPQFAPDGQEIAFAGLEDGYLDIYVLSLQSGLFEKVTDDIYSDRYPTYSPDGAVVFVSDRPDSNEEYYFGNYGIFEEQSGQFVRLTPRDSYMSSPFFGPEGGLYFVAAYDTAQNLYWYSNDSNRTLMKTDILTGIYYPSISRSGDKIAFSSLRDYGYDVCVVKNPRSKMEESRLPEERLGDFSYVEEELDGDNVRNYTPKFTLDYFVASASYLSMLGFSGLGQIGFSDILGNHHIQIAADFYGSIISSDIFLNYWYLKKRTDFGFALFQYLTYFRENYDLLVWRRLGGGVVTQYPFHRFFRTEVGLYAYKLYETRWLDYFPTYIPDRHVDANYNFFYPSLAFVFDNVRWGNINPHSGRRVRLEGYTTVPGVSDFDIRSVILDYRRYFPLSPRASFAVRIAMAGSFSDDQDRWTIGGPYSLRGYDYYAFDGPKIGFMNIEYRFPFIDRLRIAFPLPLELRDIRGVIFADMGGVYTDSFSVYSTDGGFHLEDLKLGVGGGLRFSMFYIIFKLDWARAHNLRGWIDENGNRSEWKFYLTIGPDW